jgi:hypothetical protein
MIGFITPYTFKEIGTTGKCIAIVSLHTLQFTVPYALRFSAFTGHILAKDLSQFHCNFNSHKKSSWHSLIPFLPFLQLPIPNIWLSSSQLLFYTPCYFAYTSLRSRQTLLITTLHGLHEKTPFSVVKNSCLLVCYLTMGLLLLSACVAGMCLPTRYLATGTYIAIYFNCV